MSHQRSSISIVQRPTRASSCAVTRGAMSRLFAPHTSISLLKKPAPHPCSIQSLGLTYTTAKQIWNAEVNIRFGNLLAF